MAASLPGILIVRGRGARSTVLVALPPAAVAGAAAVEPRLAACAGRSAPDPLLQARTTRLPAAIDAIWRLFMFFLSVSPVLRAVAAYPPQRTQAHRCRVVAATAQTRDGGRSTDC